MYLWQVKSRRFDQNGALDVTRLVITSSKNADDARYRMRSTYQMQDEELRLVKFVSYIPGIIETTGALSSLIFYVKAAYRMPKDPLASERVRRIVTDFQGQLDASINSILEISFEVGPISVGPSDPVDSGLIGVVICMPDDEPSTAADIVSSHIMKGAVAPEDIVILHMQAVKADETL
jgi:hypothetical protein